MKALKKIDIEELMRRQAMLDKKFDEKETIRKRSDTRLRIAYITELGELAQELKNEWNYWKNSTKEIDKTKVLEELSDLLHFYLSHLNTEKRYLRCETAWVYQDIEMLDLEKALYELITPSISLLEGTFAAILCIVKYVRATEKEFLKVHHEKWLKNMNERIKEKY